MFENWSNIGIFVSIDSKWGEQVDIVLVVPPETAKMVNMFMRASQWEPSMVVGVQVIVTLSRNLMIVLKKVITIYVRLL